MNHKDTRMTLRYAKLTPDSRKVFVEQLPFKNYKSFCFSIFDNSSNFGFISSIFGKLSE